MCCICIRFFLLFLDFIYRTNKNYSKLKGFFKHVGSKRIFSVFTFFVVNMDILQFIYFPYKKKKLCLHTICIYIMNISMIRTLTALIYSYQRIKTFEYLTISGTNKSLFFFYKTRPLIKIVSISFR